MVNKKRQAPEQLDAGKDALVPATETPEWALEPSGEPGEFGLPQDVTHLKNQVWNRQELFLAAYRKCGKIGKAAIEAGMTRWAVDHWKRLDAFDFLQRLDAAHADYCETIEQMILDDAPWIPLWINGEGYALVKPEVKQYFLTPMTIPKYRYVYLRQ